MTARDPAADVDLALFRLRRIWQRWRLQRDLCATGGDTGFHLSNMYVVHGVASIAADAGEVTIGAVAEHLGIDPSTASRLVAGAIEAGVVSRRPSTTDARRARLDLTDSGRQLLARATRKRQTFIAGLMDDWSARDREAFAELLTRFADAAHATPDPGSDPAACDEG